MDYIDTNVVLSLINPADSNHDIALRLTRESKEMAISMVTLLEMKSLMARTTSLREEEIEAYVQYLNRLGFDQFLDKQRRALVYSHSDYGCFH